MGDRNWSTFNEVYFVERLGKGIHSKSLKVKDVGREQMLRRYQQAVMMRSNWDNIDKGEVMATVERELMEFLPY